MEAVVALIRTLARSRDEGQDLIEYGLLAGLIAVIAVAAMTAVGTTINTLFWQTFANAI
jgi:pilus assembly protein Flp/PilA